MIIFKYEYSYFYKQSNLQKYSLLNGLGYTVDQ